MPELHSRIEEADAGIALHVANSLKYNVYRVIVYSPDLVQKAAGGHLGLLLFSAKHDMHLLKYKLVDLHKSILYLIALKNKVHWETSG